MAADSAGFWSCPETVVTGRPTGDAGGVGYLVLVFAFVGVLWLWTVYSLVEELLFLRRSVTVRATVVDVERKTFSNNDGDGPTREYAVVEFGGPSGSTIHAEAGGGHNPGTVPLGGRVYVRYDPRNPDRVVMARLALRQEISAVVFATLLGLVLIVVTSILF